MPRWWMYSNTVLKLYFISSKYITTNISEVISVRRSRRRRRVVKGVCISARRRDLGEGHRQIELVERTEGMLAWWGENEVDFAVGESRWCDDQILNYTQCDGSRKLLVGGRD